MWSDVQKILKEGVDINLKTDYYTSAILGVTVFVALVAALAVYSKFLR